MNAHRKLRNQVKTLEDVNQDCWINDKYFYQNTAQEEKDNKEDKEEDENTQLLLQDLGQDSDREIGPPKIINKKIKKMKKEKKKKKKEKKEKKKAKREKSQEKDCISD